MPRYVDADPLKTVFTEKSTENICGMELCKAIIDRIDRMPTVDVVPVKHGEWIAEPNCYYRCSECGSHFPSIHGYMYYNYCPDCGADMRGDKNV